MLYVCRLLHHVADFLFGKRFCIEMFVVSRRNRPVRVEEYTESIVRCAIVRGVFSSREGEVLRCVIFQDVHIVMGREDNAFLIYQFAHA